MDNKELIKKLINFDADGADTSTGFVPLADVETEITKTAGYKVGKLFLEYLLSQPTEYIEISFDGLLSYNKKELDDIIMSSNYLELRVQAPEGNYNQNDAYNLANEYISLSLCPYDKDGNLKKDNICNLYEQFKDFVDNYNPGDDMNERVEYIYNEYGYISEERGANIRDEVSEADIENCFDEIQSYLKELAEDFIWENEELLEELGYEI